MNQVVWAFLALIVLFNSVQRRNLDHYLRSGVYTLLSAPLSDLSATATLHILWLACIADGNSLLYIYVDLSCNINRAFFPPLCRQMDQNVWQNDHYHQGNFGQNWRLSAHGSIGFQMTPSYDPMKVHPVVTGRMIGNWIWDTVGK